MVIPRSLRMAASLLNTTYSSMSGVPPIPLTNTRTESPLLNGPSSRIGVASISVISSAEASFIRWRPGSPWMPIPISISSSAISKVGLPAAGTVQLVRAMPIERTLSWTFSTRAFAVARSAPPSAAPPTIFSASTVPPTPRRPAV